MLKGLKVLSDFLQQHGLDSSSSYRMNINIFVEIHHCFYSNSLYRHLYGKHSCSYNHAMQQIGLNINVVLARELIICASFHAFI